MLLWCLLLCLLIGNIGCWLCCRLLCGLLTDILNVIRTNLVKPTTIILVCIEIKSNGKFFALLYIELFYTLLTKYIKSKILRILPLCFNHIRLRHPRVSCTCRSAAVCRQYCDNFSCNFHLFVNDFVNEFICKDNTLFHKRYIILYSLDFCPIDRLR